MPHADQYLVKATISNGENAIATALAAGSDLAIADDLAKTRALALLGFDQVEEKTQSPVVELTEASMVPNASVGPTEADITAPAVIAETTQPMQTITSVESHGSGEDVSNSDDDDVGRPLDSFTPDEAPAPSEVPASSLAASAIEHFDNTHPVDLSDIIAQTDVEMARLGWSSAQGRGYLEKTFSKRSRQQLTDEELLTFLLYLESQATPSMA